MKFDSYDADEDIDEDEPAEGDDTEDEPYDFDEPDEGDAS